MKSITSSYITATQMQQRTLMHLKYQALYLNSAKMPFIKYKIVASKKNEC